MLIDRILLAFSAMALTACAAQAPAATVTVTQPAEPQPTVTVTETLPPVPQPTVTVTEVMPAEGLVPPDEFEYEEEGTGGNNTWLVPVPNVIGWRYWDGVEFIRASGLETHIYVAPGDTVCDLEPLPDAMVPLKTTVHVYPC